MLCTVGVQLRIRKQSFQSTVVAAAVKCSSTVLEGLMGSNLTEVKEFSIY